MTGEVGYDPARVAALKHHTLRALDAIDRIRSSDVAADGAMHAVRRLRTTLDLQWMPAITAIERHDPLVRAPHGFAPVIDGGIDWNTVYGSYQEFPVTLQSDDDLIADLDENGQMMIAVHGMPDPGAPFWHDEFPALVSVVLHHTLWNPYFADRLIAEASANPLIGLIVAHGLFPPRVVAGVLAGTVTAPPGLPGAERFEVEATLRLIGALAPHPEHVVALLVDIEFTRALIRWDELIDWNDAPGHAALVDFIVSGLVVANDVDPTLRDASIRALTNFVALSGETVHDTSGFPAPVAQALAVAVGHFATTLLDGSTNVCVIPSGAAGDAAAWDRTDLLDFFGAIVRDATSRAILAATIQYTAQIAAPGDAVFDLPYSVRDVSALGVLLHDAVLHEHLEIEANVAEVTAIVGAAFDLVDLGVGQLLTLSGVGTVGSHVISILVGQVESTIRDGVPSPTVGAPNYILVANLMIETEILRYHVEHPPHAATVAPGLLADARVRLDALDAVLADPASRFDEIEQAVTGLRNVMDRVVGTDRLSAILDSAFYVPATTTCDPGPVD